MALLNILQYPDERLHTVAQPVAEIDERIQTLVKDMFETMYESRGIGLAATQVDVHERVVVMDLTEDKSEPRVFINPVIIEKTAKPLTKKAACRCRAFTTPSPAPNVLKWKHWTKKAKNSPLKPTACWRFVSSTNSTT